MSTIQTQDFNGLFTKYMVRVLDIQPEPTQFLKSFFKETIASTKEVSTEVRRHHENISVDITRGTEGTYNRFDQSTEKVYIPPFFEEFLILNELDGYDRMFAMPQMTTMDQFAQVTMMAAQKVNKLKYKIMRKQELMCAQVFQTGIITLQNSDNIDFRRQGTSKRVLTSGARWNDSGVNPHTILQEGARFIRQQGLAGGGDFNVIFGSRAWQAYLDNPETQSLSDNRRFKLHDIVSPIPFGRGADFLGRISAGTYNFNCWGYERFYNPPGTTKSGKVPYIDPEQVIILPNDVMFDFSYAAVPRIQRGMNAEMPEYVAYTPGDFVIDNYLDDRNTAHVIRIRSAGMPIPTQVDALFNVRVIDPV